MRGEHCIAGASVLTFMALILLVFANIGQVSTAAVTNSIYMVQVDVKAFGSAVQSSMKKAPNGLYQTQNLPLGTSKGLRQTYRYGIYHACAYQKDNSGICNSTQFGYPFVPLAQLTADAPSAPVDYKKVTQQIIPATAASFKDNSWNNALSRVGSMLIFIGSALTLLAFIGGLVKHRLTFFFASVCAGLSALCLLIGCSIWTSVIAKDAWLKVVKVEGKVPLGILVTAGPTLYLAWVAFALVALSVFPYVVSCCTFRK